MLAAFTLVLVVAVSILVTRVATVALTLTGLSHEAARFQARSALTGAGFTTSESEAIVNHPVRRRIVMTLMLMGSAGIVTVVATAAVGFTGDAATTGGRVGQVVTLLVGLGLLWAAAASRAVDKALQPIIHSLLRRYTDIDTRDYARLLHVAGDFSVTELAVEPGDWLAGRELQELRLNDEGVLVLGIQRADGSYLGAPKGWAEIGAGDTLVLYGTGERLAELDDRRAGIIGEQMHEQAVEEMREFDEAAQAEDTARVERADDWPRRPHEDEVPTPEAERADGTGPAGPATSEPEQTAAATAEPALPDPTTPGTPVDGGGRPAEDEHTTELGEARTTELSPEDLPASASADETTQLTADDLHAAREQGAEDTTDARDPADAATSDA